MSSIQTSRTPPPTYRLSLADVVQRIRDHENLPLHRRQDYVSACNTAGRVLAQDLTAIPADPVLLRRRLAEACPRAAGLRGPRWNNVRSLVGRAVSTVVPVTASRRRNALTDDWTVLQSHLKAPFPRVILTSLMRSASERGISPGDADLSLFNDYRADLLGSLKKNPELTYDAVCRAWNNATASVPGWPSLIVTPTVRRKTWTLPWSSFPDSLVSEVHAWLSRGEDLLADLPCRPLRPATIKLREYQYRQAASALVLEGHNPASLQSLADLTTLDAFKEILRHLINRRGGVPRGQVSGIAALLSATARNKVAAPQAQLDTMRAIIRRIKPRQTGMTERNRNRLRAFDDTAVVQMLVRLPERLMAEVARIKGRQKAARLAQIALAIDLLLMAPLRIGNLAALDLRRHVARSSNGKMVSITIEGDEVKNGVPLEYPLPPPTVTLLDAYLRTYRDCLITGETTALFPGRDGKARARTGLAVQISKTVKAYTGLTINVHLFRHIGAKLFLEDNPAGHEVVRLALGHRSISTTTGFYTGTESAAAMRHYHQTILRHKAEGASR